MRSLNQSPLFQVRAFVLLISSALIFNWMFLSNDLFAGENGNQGLGGIEIDTFTNDVRTFYSTEEGLPSNEVSSVILTEKGTLYAATSKGLARFGEGKFHPVKGSDESAGQLAVSGETVFFSHDHSVSKLSDGEVSKLFSFAKEQGGSGILSLAYDQDKSGLLIGTSDGLYLWKNNQLSTAVTNHSLFESNPIYEIAAGPSGELALGTEKGLILVNNDRKAHLVFPSDEKYNWSLKDVKGVAYDSEGRLWFGSEQGAGVREGEEWTLFTGREGLPYNHVTTIATAPNGDIWFGTQIGAIRKEKNRWRYRQGKRWLPDDLVQDIAVNPNGDIWFATSEGVGLIHPEKMTLSDKAKFFEEEIDKYHRRTPYEYVLEVRLKNPGEKSEVIRHDSDNDGLWTSMYGAGECFAYAATKDPKAKERANKAMKAIGFLSEVTQGGEHPAPHGFPARTILPIDGRNPNDHDNREHDLERQKRDPLWKVIEPRWPVSADGKWYWKTDTSSDELDGHFFFYGLYYDLVAETPEEKAYVRKVVKRITDHLIDHNFNLVDHDGKPTRWGRFSPEELNVGLDFAPGLRGLNSVSVLSYIKVAYHVTGDQKYQDAYMRLIKDHQYDTNSHYPKWQSGPGTGNQSDDEMAFMNFYNLFNYETDPELRKHFLYGFFPYWRLEEPERCPLFNYIFAACFEGIERYNIKTPPSCIEDALTTLVDYPVDRINWGYQNSHRNDIIDLWVAFPRYANWNYRRGFKSNRKVIPIDERFVNHWNNDNWRLDEETGPNTLSCGTSFLLPYYMGLYYGFIIDESLPQKK